MPHNSSIIDSEEVLGVLINNLGTPDSYQVQDVRNFLKEFLWDPRVVKLPRFIWWFVLNLIILNTRPERSAKAYRKIWTADGSPLLSISSKLTDLIQYRLQESGAEILVELGMRYGKPSIESGIQKLKDAGATRFLVLPLYPQFSCTTTASVEDEVDRVFQNTRSQNFEIVKHYFSEPEYIGALRDSVKSFWDEHGKAEVLLMSFHGIPQAYSDDGDPYQEQCRQTAELLAKSLNLGVSEWRLSFQSRLGPKKWLEPYTDKSLIKMAGAGIRSVQVICPGFSVDCLETLEEIAIENREIFIESGGRNYHYIPCLNDSESHANMLVNQILRHTK
jgi:ferrochelatase